MDFSKSILIVDDMEVNRAILGETFKDSYNIIEAEDGAQALEILKQHSRDIVVVLLDIVMPKKDGFDVLQEIRSNSYVEHIPVVFITGDNSEDSEKRGYELGVADIVTKPFNPYIVKRRIQNIIDLYMHKNDLEYLVNIQTQKIQLQATKLKESNAFAIDTLSAIVEFRDLESGEHVNRIREYTRVLLECVAREYPEYGITEEMIDDIAAASVLHDVGKIAIPDAILLKPARLTVEEFEVMKLHTVRGCEILNKLNYIHDNEYFRFSYDICRSHHERWDGKGYPDGLKGDDIPIWAQVVSIADVYDALINPRVYKAAFSIDKSIDMIFNGECGSFSPKLLRCFRLVEQEFVKMGSVSVSC